MFIPKTLDDLNRIVGERLEEATRLEFKRQLPESGKNDDLARDLAAMANTEGGVIVYGIEEDDTGRAKAVSPFPLRGAAERVTLVAQTLDEPLALLSVSTIPSDGAPDEGYLIVEVPNSERAPHFVRGLALGRTPKGNFPLTRRQVGQLFARSPGFAQEFGMTTGRPGRVLVGQKSEPYQETDSRGRLKTKRRYYLIFENDGEADVFDAAWEWVTEEANAGVLPTVLQDPFPLEVFQRGVQLSVSVHAVINTPSDLRVRTRWRDRNGEQHEQVWPITW